MTTTASKVLRVARAQIGVTEWPANSNKTKYGRDYGWNGTFWCAIFVWWCFWKAGLSRLIAKSASAADIQDDTVTKHGGTWIMRKTTSANTRKAYLRRAKPGDIVSFDFGAMDAVRDHVGIVESVSGNYIICIEGNTSKNGSQSNGGMVCRQKRSYISICSAVRPKFEEPPKPDPINVPLKVDGIFDWQTIYKMQVWLNVQVDGDIGPATTKALQKKVGATQDGEWGVLTTKALQTFLNKKGADLDVDGEFGPLSTKALQTFLNDYFQKPKETTEKKAKKPAKLYIPKQGEKCYDLSNWQGKLSVDYFKGIKKKGVSCVILRSSFTRGASFTMGKDAAFDHNIKNAIKAGMHIGTYHFSQAINDSESGKEADFVLDVIEPYADYIDLPVGYDFEWYGRLSRDLMKKNGKTKNGAIVTGFCKKVKKAGYEPMVYASLVVFNDYLPAAIYKNYKIWVAQYYSRNQYKHPYYLWQYTSNDGKLDESVFGTQDTKVVTKADQIVEKATKLAYKQGVSTSRYSFTKGKAKQAYEKALDKIFPEHNKWKKDIRTGASCSVYVATVMRATVDPTFRCDDPPKILDYMEDMDKWKKVNAGLKPVPVDKLHPGDIICYEKLDKSTGHGGGHILLYKGDGYICEANYGRCYPHTAKLPTGYTSESYISKTFKRFAVYRIK